MLEICLLGTGGMMPLPDRFLTSMMLRFNGRMILIDCGEGTQLPMKMLGWGFKALDAICITHFHADHIAGLTGLLLTIANSGRSEPLVLIGPPGLLKVVEGLTVIAPELPYELNIIELTENNVSNMNIGAFMIKSAPAEHSLPCLAYSIEINRPPKFDPQKALENDIPKKVWNRLQKGETIIEGDMFFTPEMVLKGSRNGIKVCYCTDTRPTDILIDLAKSADILICEGMYGEDSKIEKAIEKKHMTFSEAAHMAKAASAKELWLTHFSPSLVNPEDYLHIAAEIFENSHVGIPLMTKAIKFEKEAK